MSLEIVAEWLEPYGVDKFEGKCLFTYEHEIEVTIETDIEGKSLFVSALIGEIGSDADAAMLRHLLQMGYKGQHTGGASLSVDETGQGVVLWIARLVSTLDPEAFDDLVGRFLDSASDLRRDLFSGGMAGRTDDDRPTPDRLGRFSIPV
ncbi:MAG: type III secretion system chaperone [Minwuiales bacterium]|nr:type III secretion system chaperone [Minwuiales bacterium]